MGGAGDIAQAGPVQIELIKQHDDRASVYRDLFAKGESGFHQLCTVTPDYDGKKAHYERLGYELPRVIADAEHRLYDRLASENADAAHSRYNALVRRLVSFERAAACVD